MDTNPTQPESWSIHEAIAVSFNAFGERFGEDVLWLAFAELARERDATLDELGGAERDINQYLMQVLNKKGSELDLWISSARADGAQALTLLQIGVRWWLARDDLLSRPAQSRVPCQHAEGETDHVSLQLLKQMLYRGAAPYTTCN
ncbi:hypothetical protein [Alicycliphilus denitrificans]|uniref:hypothetical protein n=1 Tax=Alicycliphilus denitrificans TaxID=179636 RepID=UPI0001D9EDED|nr:hypothetical protein [Alicycliphilus denitrificans]ADU99804.1 hypothetical protein Alide_2061 [Alicycliphilus denitrificans BC]